MKYDSLQPQPNDLHPHRWASAPRCRQHMTPCPGAEHHRGQRSAENSVKACSQIAPVLGGTTWLWAIGGVMPQARALAGRSCQSQMWHREQLDTTSGCRIKAGAILHVSVYGFCVMLPNKEIQTALKKTQQTKNQNTHKSILSVTHPAGDLGKQDHPSRSQNVRGKIMTENMTTMFLSSCALAWTAWGQVVSVSQKAHIQPHSRNTPTPLSICSSRGNPKPRSPTVVLCRSGRRHLSSGTALHHLPHSSSPQLRAGTRSQASPLSAGTSGWGWNGISHADSQQLWWQSVEHPNKCRN